MNFVIEQAWQSKWPEQPPSLQCMGSCDSHQSSLQSLGQQPFTGRHPPEDWWEWPGFTSCIWWCTWKVSKLEELDSSQWRSFPINSGSQPEWVEKLKKIRHGSYTRLLQFPKWYLLICLRCSRFLLSCNRRGTLYVYGGFTFHILIACSEHRSLSLRSSIWKSVFTWRLREVE